MKIFLLLIAFAVMPKILSAQVYLSTQTPLSLQATSYVLYPNYSSYSGGFSTKTANYQMCVSFAQHSAYSSEDKSSFRSSSSYNYKTALGFITYFIKKTLFGPKLEFVDEYPKETDIQKTTKVTCRITLTSDTGLLNPTKVEYKIFNNYDLTPSSSTIFLSSADKGIVIVSSSTNQATFEVSFPNPVGWSFSEGNNNYIQWFYRDEAGNKIGDDGWSKKYYIKIKINDAPKITILQPREFDILSINPTIEAKIEDECWGVNPSSITIEIKDTNSNIVYQISNKPEIWDEKKQKVFYQIKDKDFSSGKYTLTLTVSDYNNKVSTKTRTFFVKSGEIADVVPYPSPFDPNKTPLKIRYTLKQESYVTISIYNQAGFLVKNIINNEPKPAGINEEEWFGENFAGEKLANDVYFCEVIAKNKNGENRYYTSVILFRKK
jgi:hypothetical protein